MAADVCFTVIYDNCSSVDSFGRQAHPLTEKKALVVHPKLSVYAGAEYLCLFTCRILQEMGYVVTLVSDVFDPPKAQELFGMGSVLSNCKHLPVPSPTSGLPRLLLPFERLVFTVRLAAFANRLKKTSADIIFSTQSSIFPFPGKRLYHFVYEVQDLFCYPMPIAKGSKARGGLGKGTTFRLLRLLFRSLAGSPKPTWFFVAGHGVLAAVESRGYTNVSFFYPPARMLSVKLPKKNQIVQACRVAPEKRLEFMFKVARMLPNYTFFLVGKKLPSYEESNPGYADHLLSDKPNNVQYIEGLIRDRLDLLEESKVYFHSGLEKGILLILIEALSAGAILVAPREGVAGEVVRASGTGYEYDSADEAAEKIKQAVEGLSPWSPSEIGERAKTLGPAAFDRLIRRVVGDEDGKFPREIPRIW